MYKIKETILLFIIILTFNSCNSQTTSDSSINSNIKNTIEFDVSAMFYNYENKDCIEIIRILSQYHHGYNSWDSINRSWDTSYYKKYTYLDQSLRGEMYFFEREKDLTANLIDITKNADSTYIARVLYSYSKNNKNINFAIYNFYARRNHKNELKLVPFLEIANKGFKSNTFGSLSIYEESQKKLSELELKKINSWNDSLASFFNVNKSTVKIYHTKNVVSIYKIIGFDSYYKMNQNKVLEQSNAIADAVNNIIYTPDIVFAKHELVHLYTFKAFQVNWNYHMYEGIATFLAGSGNSSLEIHLKKLSKHLKLHPENNFSNIFDYQYNMVDSNTGYMYTIFGLLCKLVYEKEGKQGVLDFVNSGPSEDDVYNAIGTHLGIKKNNVNDFLRNKIMEY